MTECVACERAHPPRNPSDLASEEQVFRGLQDERAVAATVVSEVTDDAPVVPSTHSAIADVRPIQLAIESAIDPGEEDREWVRNTLTSEWDMDGVEEALENLEQHETEEGPMAYYIEHEEAGQQYMLALIFGIPEDA